MAARKRALVNRVELWSKTDPERFWAIEQNDATLTRRFGVVGKSMRVTQKTCRDWFFASRELDAAVAAQLEKGFSRTKSVPRDDGARAILDALDAAQLVDRFPALESFEWIFVGARLHAFADAARKKWALYIEELTFSQNARDRHQLKLFVHAIGTDVWKQSPRILPGARDVGRDLRSAKPLSERERDAFFAAPTTVAKWPRKGLRHLMTLDDWNHPDGPPSESETFQRIAAAMTTGDARAYRPAGKPNLRTRGR